MSRRPIPASTMTRACRSRTQSNSALRVLHPPRNLYAQYVEARREHRAGGCTQIETHRLLIGSRVEHRGVVVEAVERAGQFESIRAQARRVARGGCRAHFLLEPGHLHDQRPLAIVEL